MFSNKSKQLLGGFAPIDEIASTPVVPRRTSSVPSIISADMTIRGNLKCPGRLQIEGTVLGDIEVGQLVIADGAVVQGEIDAQEVEIGGALTGLVRAREVTLRATARVAGDLYHEMLSIEAGAMLEGQCRRLSSDSQVATTPWSDMSVQDRVPNAKTMLESAA